MKFRKGTRLFPERRVRIRASWGKKCTDALTNSVHSSGWTTRDPSASGLCQNDGLQAVVVWQLRLHTSHIGEQPEGKHWLRILRE